MASQKLNEVNTSTENTNILDKTTQDVLTSWLYKPLPNVSNRTAGLDSAPVSGDSFSQLGCKSQNATTWNTISRSYYVGHAVRHYDVKFKHEQSQPKTVFKPLNIRMIEDITEDELKYISPIYIERIRNRECGLGYKNKLIKLKDIQDIPEHTPNQINTEIFDDVTFDYGDQAPGCSSLHSDSVPVKICAVNNWCDIVTMNTQIPFSTMYTSFMERISDPQSTGVLGSLIRGLSCRDGTSIMSLVKTMKNHPSSVMEHAAIVRAACIATSLTVANYMYDPMYGQVIRRFIVDNTKRPKIAINTDLKTYGLNVLAITIDMYTALMNNKLEKIMPSGWQYSNMDTDVAVVPISSTALSNPWVLAYIASFLDSSLWSGRINYIIEGSWLLEDWNPDRANRGTITVMPSINSVLIPGAMKCLLVLVDYTSVDSANTVTLGETGLFVNVIKNNTTRQPTDISNYWDNNYFIEKNLQNIAGHATSAYNEIVTKLSVNVACGHALSIASELYGVLYPGICFDVNSSGIITTSIPNGCWAFGSGAGPAGPIDSKNGQVYSNQWNENMSGADNSTWREALVGFNFSGLSPMHLLPTCLSRTVNKIITKPATDDKFTIPYCVNVAWASRLPDLTNARYNINTMNGPMRVGTYVGLINTDYNAMTMSSASALAAYVHMNSVAIALSTANFICNNDLPLHTWTGLNINISNLSTEHKIDKIMKSVSLNMINYVNIINRLRSVNYWDWDCIVNYYHIDPHKSLNLYTYSPVPITSYSQWKDKLDLSYGKLDNYLHQGVVEDVYYEGVNVTRTTGHYKAAISGSIDVIRHCPNVVYIKTGRAGELLKVWANNWSFLSNMQRQCNMRNMIGGEFFQTGTLCLPNHDWDYETTIENIIMVLNSKCIIGDVDRTLIKSTPIVYPDPPSQNSFLTAARDYLMIPALSALTGYVTGGPVGSLISGGAAVGKQLAKDLIGSKEKIPDQLDHVNDVGESLNTMTTPETNEANE